ncbi:MAG: C1 family peptidase [Chitinophagaceae bacterium]|nr:C1 family peptidase [Chitinophagaceae bacterium]
MSDTSNIEELKKLQEENEKLKQKLLDFKRLEEELLVDKVFKSAKDKLVKWYTLGGIGVFLVSIWGINSALNYTRGVAEKKLESVTEKQIQDIIEKKSDAQVKELLAKQEDTLRKKSLELVKQKIDEIKLATGPIGTTQDSGKISISIPTNVPPKIDLSNQVGDIRDQGSESSAVAFSVTYALEISYFNKTGEVVRFSPRYIYNSVNNNSNNGIYFNDVFKLLIDKGTVEENAWPYVQGQYNLSQPASVSVAKKFKIKSFTKINGDTKSFKEYLAAKQPIVAGYLVYESFYNTNSSGLLSIPGTSTQGYTSLCMVGYDDEKQLFKFKNSWGTTWGNNGYGYISYKDIEKLIREAYIIEL